MANVQVALLRGINVGPSKRVKMADLRALVEELGYGSVRTLLNSGNVVFSSPGTAPEQTARRIQEALLQKLAVSVRVVVISAAELADIARRDWGKERISRGASRALYMWMPRGVIESKLNAAVGNALGDGVTSRNWATILKLFEMAQDVMEEERLSDPRHRSG